MQMKSHMNRSVSAMSIWPTEFGVPVFTFDGKKWYYLFRDCPQALTPEEREIFEKEEPFWADFFRNPNKDNTSE